PAAGSESSTPMSTTTFLHPVLHPNTPTARLAEELDDLGDDPDRIADILWLTGCRGPRDDESAHPLACYLRRRLHLTSARLVTPGRVEVVTGDEMVTVSLPVAVREFLARFAEGLYPELDAR